MPGSLIYIYWISPEGPNSSNISDTSQLESQCAAQELAFTKLQNQEAALKDSLAKMAALSEGLANDKVELNRILLQVSRCEVVM